LSVASALLTSVPKVFAQVANASEETSAPSFALTLPLLSTAKYGLSAGSVFPVGTL